MIRSSLLKSTVAAAQRARWKEQVGSKSGGRRVQKLLSVQVEGTAGRGMERKMELSDS